MQYLVLTLGLMAALALGLRAFTRASPARMARHARQLGFALLLGLAGLLLARGQLSLALGLLAFGLPALLAGHGGWLGGAKSPGQTSGIETPLLRMQLDHDSGEMSGEVLAGPHAGRSLGALSRDDLLVILKGCVPDDPRSAALLEAYLDHRFPDWRETMPPPAEGAGPLTVSEARAILGVEADASEDEIRAAWRAQMKRNHPDHGGSAYLAAKINQAKDVLLNR